MDNVDIIAGFKFIYANLATCGRDKKVGAPGMIYDTLRLAAGCFILLMELLILPHEALAAQVRDIPSASSAPATCLVKENPTLKEFGIFMS
jgi:hypothetical protein